MYRWEIDEVAQPEFDSLPPEAKAALTAFMDAAVISDSMQFLRGADEPPEKNLRVLSFGPDDRGMVSFLVYMEDDLALVVQIAWAG